MLWFRVRQDAPWSPIISGTFTEAERERFHNLLKLAAESPFEGERENALVAARRLATRRGMTLEEAARADALAVQREAPRQTPPSVDINGLATSVHLMDQHLYNDKLRRDEALAKARARGLDRAELSPRHAARIRSMSKRRMRPETHAAVLLRETQLPFREVAEITGLDIYQVVGMKLKLRNPHYSLDPRAPA